MRERYEETATITLDMYFAVINVNSMFSLSHEKVVKAKTSRKKKRKGTKGAKREADPVSVIG